ncbi:MAG: Gfo/Idh/MocA family oxidoreductase, partial [Alphaproteobacteria bacterium]|nr:Gfo/Idh/MocA family oxidoreductase [Alphaproteobacteria bacterium]
MTKIALVGTGFVADYYMTTLANYPGLVVAGTWDRDADRLAQFCRFHDVRAYGSLAECLGDGETEILVNLTAPESHFELNCAALNAGKHVYCEKPLGMTFEEARAVIDLADDKGLTVCGAPANGLSDAQQLVAGLIADGRIGAPRLAYAEMEDGPVFKDNWTEWRSRSGAKWPGLHEFEVGCTLEHAGYGLSWLVSLFGAVEEGQAFSALTFPDKGPGTRDVAMAPDFAVGCLSFRSGVTAR